MAKYEIHWRVKATGAVGHGAPMPEKTAENWLAEMERTNPEMEQWLVPEATR